jgi:hypothetical protein
VCISFSHKPRLKTLTRTSARGPLTPILGQRLPLNLTTWFSVSPFEFVYVLTCNVSVCARYPNLNMQIYKPQQVKLLYSGANEAYLNEIVQISERKCKQYELARDSHNLLRWMQRHLEPYRATVKVVDLTMSWRSGLALCALIHRYRPELV